MSEQKIVNTFDKMRATIDQYTTVVRENGALWRSIEELGGDPAWLNDIKTALDAVYSAIDEADMGARAHLDAQEESVENTLEGEGGMFIGAAGTPYPEDDYEEDNPVKDAIIHRLSVRYGMEDLLKKYGLDRVEAAIDDVAGFHSDAEELGSSDISIMVKQVMDNLEATNEGLDYLKKLAGI